MARYRIGLSPIGVGKLIAFAGIGIYVGLHSLAVSLGLAEPAHPHAAQVSASTPSYAERDAEVKRMIAEREARAQAIRASEGR